MKSPSWFAANAATAAAMPANASLAKLLASHILRDGEVVVVILRPSLWFIFFNSLRFIIGGIVLILAARLLSHQSHAAIRGFVEAGVSAICGRLMWSTVQWMGRLYILTDMRVLSLSGVFNVSVFDCPLRKVASTALIQSLRDRLVGVGSIRIVPGDPNAVSGEWQTIAHPGDVHEQMMAAISRAKQGGMSE